MNKIRKMLAWMVLAAMPMTGAVAQAEGIERAAQPLEIQDFEHYSSCAYDEATGKWSLRTIESDAMLDRFWSYGAESGSALCVFDLELEGDARTGVWTPVLRFYHMNGKKINARAVSLLVCDQRYDLAAVSGTASNGVYSAQMISAPLTAEALEAVKSMIGKEEVSVRLIGDNVFTTELDVLSTNSRRKVGASSLTGLEKSFALLETAGLNTYGLWDLSAAAWEKEYGFEPACQNCQVEKSINGVKMTDDFGMVMRYDQTNACTAAQKILIENGYMNGPTTGSFGKNSVAATLRAQKYLGLIETGCMDAMLEKAIVAGRTEEAETEAELNELGGVAAVALNRYWFAEGVSAVNEPASMRTVSNGDNVFVVVDGEIENISGAELRLFTEVEASVLCNGVAFEATVSCERDKGCELDVTMLPMAKARLVVYAEVPGYLAQAEDVQWSVQLTANGESVEYALQ